MAHVDRPRASSRLASWAVRGTLLALLGLVAAGASQLWSEYRSLEREKDELVHSQIIGYEGIGFDLNYAAKPPNWVHDEGDSTLLWSGWESGVGHHWFRFPKGDLTPWGLQGGLGRDSVRAIYRPLFEVGGGRRWERIPWDATVANFELDGVACAYPIVILQKTLVVHDAIHDRAFLVMLSPASPTHQSVRLFDLSLDGAPPALGHSGYFLDSRPILFDRQSESLWLPGNTHLEAIAGRRKGTRLPELARPGLTSWSDWRSTHPDGRLLIGADRRGDPASF